MALKSTFVQVVALPSAKAVTGIMDRTMTIASSSAKALLCMGRIVFPPLYFSPGKPGNSIVLYQFLHMLATLS